MAIGRDGLRLPSRPIGSRARPRARTSTVPVRDGGCVASTAHDVPNPGARNV